MRTVVPVRSSQPLAGPVTRSATTYEAGGPVAEMQATLADRIAASQQIQVAPADPIEEWTQRLSRGAAVPAVALSIAAIAWVVLRVF